VDCGVLAGEVLGVIAGRFVRVCGWVALLPQPVIVAVLVRLAGWGRGVVRFQLAPAAGASARVVTK